MISKSTSYSTLKSNLSFIFLFWFVIDYFSFSKEFIFYCKGIPQPRAKSDDQSNPNIYEMRSYWLKPGYIN